MLCCLNPYGIGEIALDNSLSIECTVLNNVVVSIPAFCPVCNSMVKVVESSNLVTLLSSHWCNSQRHFEVHVRVTVASHGDQ